MPVRDWPHHDTQTFKIAKGRVDVYRRDDELVQGVCMSLYMKGKELMRWDLEPGKAHAHMMFGKAPRLYFPRDWSPHLIAELACSQLVEHAPIVAGIVGTHEPDAEELDAAAKWAYPLLVEGAT